MNEMWQVTCPQHSGAPTMHLSLADAMDWCVFDNYDGDIRWLVYNDCLRSAGPYAAHTNRGYTITLIAW